MGRFLLFSFPNNGRHRPTASGQPQRDACSLISILVLITSFTTHGTTLPAHTSHCLAHGLNVKLISWSCSICHISRTLINRVHCPPTRDGRASAAGERRVCAAPRVLSKKARSRTKYPTSFCQKLHDALALTT